MSLVFLDVRAEREADSPRSEASQAIVPAPVTALEREQVAEREPLRSAGPEAEERREPLMLLLDRAGGQLAAGRSFPGSSSSPRMRRMNDSSSFTPKGAACSSARMHSFSASL